MAVRDLVELPVVKAATARGLPENAPFTYWVAPDRLRYRDGVAFFLPFVVTVDPGIQNVPSDGTPDTMHGLQRRMDRVQVPLDFEVKAWGEVRKGYVQIEVSRDRNGKEILHHRDVWTRYRVIGARRLTEFDHDGFADFCKRVEDLMGGSPDPMVAEGERIRLEQQITNHQRIAAQSPVSAGVADTLRAKLTRKPKPSKDASPAA